MENQQQGDDVVPQSKMLVLTKKSKEPQRKAYSIKRQGSSPHRMLKTQTGSFNNNDKLHQIYVQKQSANEKEVKKSIVVPEGKKKEQQVFVIK